MAHMNIVKHQLYNGTHNPGTKLPNKIESAFTKIIRAKENTLMHHQEALVLNRTIECLEENLFPREDCPEFIELTVAYLGEEIPNGRKFRF